MSPRGPIAAAGSDAGRERDINEDRVLAETDKGIFAVIDGVGGESGGEVAAQTALDVLRARLSRRTTEVERLVREAIAQANKQIWERAQAEPELAGMACVLTVAVLDGTEATVGHVGDSRLYLLRRGEIRKMTRDHSPVGMREDAGEISEAEAMRHPRRNEIFRDVGSAPHEPDEEGFIDVLRVPFDPESALLLCSDGLSDLVPSSRILEVVERRAGNPKAAVKELLADANEAGGKDNISIVLVEGERFADSIRRGSGDRRKEVSADTRRLGGDDTAVTPGVSGSSGPRPVIRGAGRAKLSAGERWIEALTGRTAILLYILILVAAALFLLREPLRDVVSRWWLGGPGAPDAPALLRIGPGAADLSITDALAQAQPGQTIQVMPGEYRETIQLKDGVRLESATPRGAVIRTPPGVALPAVSAEGVQQARFAGFRIVGNAEAPLTVGLRLAGSAVEVEDVEISGATTAGVEVSGADRSAVQFSFIHDNPGTGVIVRDQAAPRLQRNLIASNGGGQGAQGDPRPGVEVRGAARPQLIDNRIEANAAAGVWVPSADRVDEIFGFNAFGSLTKEKAVRVAPKPGETPPRRPGR